MYKEIQHTNEYVGEQFRKRMEELDISIYRFTENLRDASSRPTFRRIMKGDGNTRLDSIAYYADLLGLEVIIRPKESVEATRERLGITDRQLKSSRKQK